MTVIEYLWVNIYMGAGIAADVYFATIGGFREFGIISLPKSSHMSAGTSCSKENWLISFMRKRMASFLAKPKLFRWITYNTITHTLFPLFGMYFVVIGITVWQPLTSGLFALGAYLLGDFLVRLLRERSGLINEHQSPKAEQTDNGRMHRLTNIITKHLEKIDPLLALVLGVSMDAINSGFAKATDTRNWSLGLLLLSFPLVGAVVGFFAWAAGEKAKYFLNYIKRSIEIKKGIEKGINKEALIRQLFILEMISLAIEIFVLGYFFWRSVMSAISPYALKNLAENRYIAWAASAISLILVASIYGKRIVNNIRTEAEQSFEE